MIHRLTLHRGSPPYEALGLRPWCITCDNPDCPDRYPADMVVTFKHAGPTRDRAIWAARRQGWHVSRYGVACPACMRAWDALMMSAAHRDLSLNPRQTPDPDWSGLFPYRLMRRTPRMQLIPRQT